jgi:hypothetical protein
MFGTSGIIMFVSVSVIFVVVSLDVFADCRSKNNAHFHIRSLLYAMTSSEKESEQLGRNDANPHNKSIFGLLLIVAEKGILV